MSDDLVHRAELLKLPRRKGCAVNGWEEYIRVSDVEKLPSVQPRKGKWIDGMCSECEESTQGFLTNFCPNCGADMRGSEQG